MNDQQFRAFVDLLMVSDPWPLEYGKDGLNDLADHEARERGFDGWIEAYHLFEHPGLRDCA